MISGISSATQGLTAATARFERAAAGVVSAAEPDAGAAGAGTAEMSDAMVQMATARFALLASFGAARATNDMLAQTIALGGYER